MEKDIDLTEAWKLIKQPVIIATKGKKAYDLTPIGWVTPYDYEPVTKALFACSPEHQADANIRRQCEFAILIPEDADGDLVNSTGSISGPDVDKFAQFALKAKKGRIVNVCIPTSGVKAVIECKLVKIEAEGSVDIIFGESVCAYTL